MNDARASFAILFFCGACFFLCAYAEHEEVEHLRLHFRIFSVRENYVDRSSAILLRQYMDSESLVTIEKKTPFIPLNW